MKNKLCCLIIMFFTCGVCTGQNLVPNPSFEDTLSCPTGLAEVYKAIGWSSFRESPDYFNRCADSASLVSVPSNGWGYYQQPSSGDAYCGFQTRFTPGYREILGCQLISPLVIGTKYYVNFKVVATYGPVFGGALANNKTGARFSTVLYDVTHPAPINNFAHVYTDSIIKDTINWVTIQGSFISDSAYQFVGFGNFFDDANTDTSGIFPGAVRAFYYIDDVCVSIDSLTCNSTVGISEVKNTDDFILFPNPFSDKINITIKNNNELSEIILYDISSRKLLQQKFTNSVTLNTSQLAKGIYIYELRNNPDSHRDGVIKKGKVVKE